MQDDFKGSRHHSKIETNLIDIINDQNTASDHPGLVIFTKEFVVTTRVVDYEMIKTPIETQERRNDGVVSRIHPEIQATRIIGDEELYLSMFSRDPYLTGDEETDKELYNDEMEIGLTINQMIEIIDNGGEVFVYYESNISEIADCIQAYMDTVNSPVKDQRVKTPPKDDMIKLEAFLFSLRKLIRQPGNSDEKTGLSDLFKTTIRTRRDSHIVVERQEAKVEEVENGHDTKRYKAPSITERSFNDYNS